MENEELVAPSAATEEVVTEGQVESQPAPVEETEAEKTASQQRRERRKAQEQRQREELAAKEAALKQKADEVEKLQRTIAAIKPPTDADFSDPFDLSQAKGAAYAVQQLTAAQMAQAKQDQDTAKAEVDRARAAQMQVRQDAFNEAQAEARGRYADFDAVVRNPSVFIAPQVAEMLLDSEQAADLAYHVAKDPELAARLSTMPPLAAARELGRIEAALQVPKPKIQSTAPAPINPVRPGGTSDKSWRDMTPKEFAAFRAAGGIPT